jgi:hypothetical protein
MFRVPQFDLKFLEESAAGGRNFRSGGTRAPHPAFVNVRSGAGSTSAAKPRQQLYEINAVLDLALVSGPLQIRSVDSMTPGEMKDR